METQCLIKVEFDSVNADVTLYRFFPKIINATCPKNSEFLIFTKGPVMKIGNFAEIPNFRKDRGPVRYFRILGTDRFLSVDLCHQLDRTDDKTKIVNHLHTGGRVAS